jgi:hypothetical protein
VDFEKSKNYRRVVFFAPFATAFFARAGCALVDRSAISGMVLDQSGRSVPDNLILVTKLGAGTPPGEQLSVGESMPQVGQSSMPLGQTNFFSI